MEFLLFPFPFLFSANFIWLLYGLSFARQPTAFLAQAIAPDGPEAEVLQTIAQILRGEIAATV